MYFMARKPNQNINCSLRDWENKKVLLPQSVIDYHLVDSNHLDELNYINDLKNNLNKPEIVKQSQHRNNTKLVYIKLINKKHPLLCVVIRYSHFFNSLLGKKNFIVTFYGTDKPKRGKILWKK